MKKKDLNNLKDKNLKDLREMVLKKKTEAVLAHAKIKAGQEKNTSLVKIIRRDISQILTLIRQKEIAEALEKKKEKGKEEKK